jgi:uncharacterized protein (TIGR03382 family)
MIAFVTAWMGVGVLALSWLAMRREDARGRRKA